jgi:hypothetical protein
MPQYLCSTLLLLASISISATAATNKFTPENSATKRNLVLVTIDGLRWQELFSGADPSLLKNEKFVRAGHQIKEKFWHDVSS